MSDLESKYTGVVDCTKKIYKKHGMTGFFTGLGIALVGTMIYKFAFFRLIDIFGKHATTKAKAFWFSKGVILVSNIILYPFVTVKYRMIVDNANSE